MKELQVRWHAPPHRPAPASPGGSPRAESGGSAQVGEQDPGTALQPQVRRLSTGAAADERAPGVDGGASAGDAPLRVALVGSPNVGKSALFNRLTRSYATVSNYPGTSIHLTRGPGSIDGRRAEFVDTPGIYSLTPLTEEERVTRRLVLDGEADVFVHVVEARHLERSLPLTFQLLETGRPTVVALNMMDEAERSGLAVDAAALGRRLGVEVVPTVAVAGRGIGPLERAVARAGPRAGRVLPEQDAAPGELEGAQKVASALREVRERLRGSYSVNRAALAAFLLQDDPEIRDLVARREPDDGRTVLRAAAEAADRLGDAPAYRLAVERQRLADRVAAGVVDERGDGTHRWRAALSRLLTRPATGIPILLLVLYVGLYQFVGVFGAGTVVDWVEQTAFEGWINPWLEGLFAGIPWEGFRSLYVGEYGLLTLGLRYAVAIILPVVGTFFLFFSVLEDSGYFPRLALLVDRVFKRLGLNGRAVIPLVLGFACDTMATMVTRTLETRRERVLSTVLLALAIPCSAQLGVILAVLSGQPAALAVWVGVVAGCFLLVGAVGARLMPGERASFHMELPPLRLPRPGNVMNKTLSRMHWYFMEVLPLFLLASVILWAGQLTGVLQASLRALRPVVGVLGLPADAAPVFLYGFFRRDYGAAGLFDLNQAGGLDPVGLVVAAVTLTLFVPCVAQFLMMLKERGWKMAAATFAFALGFAFSVGAALNVVLREVVGWV